MMSEYKKRDSTPLGYNSQRLWKGMRLKRVDRYKLLNIPEFRT